MERISIQIDSPGYVKVSEISEELLKFSSIIETKYNQIDFDFGFCFRALYTTRGIRSKVRFYKEDRWLGMDLIMALNEFNSYKTNVSMQRLIMGKHFFPFFVENIEKYKSKLPTRRFNYQMQLNWFHRASDKKAVQELESLVSCEVCY